jgi:hypothetical protein
MVQVDLPAAFAAGQILAMLSKRYLADEKELFTHRLMGPVAVYFALMFAPPGLFLLICWPAWESMYWWKWIETPAMAPWVSLFYIAFYMVTIITGCGSYMAAHTLYRKGKDKTVKALVVSGVITTLLPFFLWPFTWYHVGSYAQYNSIPMRTSTMFNTPAFFFSWFAVMGYFAFSSLAFGAWIKKASCPK